MYTNTYTISQSLHLSWVSFFPKVCIWCKYFLFFRDFYRIILGRIASGLAAMTLQSAFTTKNLELRQFSHNISNLKNFYRSHIL